MTAVVVAVVEAAAAAATGTTDSRDLPAVRFNRPPERSGGRFHWPPLPHGRRRKWPKAWILREDLESIQHFLPLEGCETNAIDRQLRLIHDAEVLDRTADPWSSRPIRSLERPPVPQPEFDVAPWRAQPRRDSQTCPTRA